MSNTHPLFYRRNHPHWQPAETSFFITYRLFHSIPVILIKELQQDYIRAKNLPDNRSFEAIRVLDENYFFLFGNILDKTFNEPYWLRTHSIAPAVWDSLKLNDNQKYTL